MPLPKESPKSLFESVDPFGTSLEDDLFLEYLLFGIF
jgi:hypothetical protein